MEIEMKIRGMMFDPNTKMPIVVLREEGGKRILPIWIGAYEADAIMMKIEKVETPQPMAHDLLKNALQTFGATVKKVVVNDIKDGTYYALIFVEDGGQEMSFDSRPSDAIALALRADCPIFAEEEVLRASATPINECALPNDEELKRWLENLDPDEMGHA